MPEHKAKQYWYTRTLDSTVQLLAPEPIRQERQPTVVYHHQLLNYSVYSVDLSVYV